MEPYTPPMQYLEPTPFPSEPVAPVTNGALVKYTMRLKTQLELCNVDKVTLYDLYNKNKEQ